MIRRLDREAALDNMWRQEASRRRTQLWLRHGRVYHGALNLIDNLVRRLEA